MITNRVSFKCFRWPHLLGAIMEYTLDDFFKENPKVANAILITRLSKEKADLIKEVHDDMDYRPEARIGIVGNIPEPDGMGNILIATGGTRIFLLLKKLLLLQRFTGIRSQDSMMWEFQGLTEHFHTWMK